MKFLSPAITSYVAVETLEPTMLRRLATARLRYDAGYVKALGVIPATPVPKRKRPVTSVTKVNTPLKSDKLISLPLHQCQSLSVTVTGLVRKFCRHVLKVASVS